MAKDPVRNYLEAKDQLDEIFNKVLKIRRTVTEVSQMLQQPYDFMVSGTDVAFPPGVGIARTPTLSASDWPSAKQIAQSLAALHGAYTIAQNAWWNLPDEDKAKTEKLPERW